MKKTQEIENPIELFDWCIENVKFAGWTAPTLCENLQELEKTFTIPAMKSFVKLFPDAIGNLVTKGLIDSKDNLVKFLEDAKEDFIKTFKKEGQ